MVRVCLLSLGFILAACSHGGYSSAPAAATGGGASAAGGMAIICPMAVPGTQLSTSDTDTGEALTFTTSPDQAAALRERVHAMAAMHNRHHSGEAAHAGVHGETGTGSGAGSEAGGTEMPPPSQATVEDLPDGARIVVTPNDPADVQRLQAFVRMHAQRMRERGCDMRGGESLRIGAATSPPPASARAGAPSTAAPAGSSTGGTPD